MQWRSKELGNGYKTNNKYDSAAKTHMSMSQSIKRVVFLSTSSLITRTFYPCTFWQRTTAGQRLINELNVSTFLYRSVLPSFIIEVQKEDIIMFVFSELHMFGCE